MQKKGDAPNRQLVQSELASKVPLMLQFLGHEDDDVSQGVAEFAREYIQYLKHEPGNYKQPDKANIEVGTWNCVVHWEMQLTLNNSHLSSQFRSCFVRK